MKMDFVLPLSYSFQPQFCHLCKVCMCVHFAAVFLLVCPFPSCSSLFFQSGRGRKKDCHGSLIQFCCFSSQRLVLAKLKVVRSIEFEMTLVTKCFFPNEHFYLFVWHKKREREGRRKQAKARTAAGVRQAHHHATGPQMWGSVSGPWDHDPRQNSPLNQLSHPSAPTKWFFLGLLRSNQSLRDSFFFF